MNEFLLFVFMVGAGLLLELAFHRLHYMITKTHYKEHHFTLGKYLFYLLFPYISLLIIITRLGWSVFTVFAVFAVVGTFLEWLVGFTFYHVVGSRLWTYHRYSITHYTSFLSIPLWGFAGIMFWLLARALQ